MFLPPLLLSNFFVLESKLITKFMTVVIIIKNNVQIIRCPNRGLPLYFKKKKKKKKVDLNKSLSLNVVIQFLFKTTDSENDPYPIEWCTKLFVLFCTSDPHF